MVANRQREQLPLLVAPSGRWGQAKQEFACGFLGRFSPFGIANAVQANRGEQHPAKRRVAEGSGRISSLESIEKSHGHTGNLRGAA